MIILLFIILSVGHAYREESFEIDFAPSLLRVSDACTLYGSELNGTFVQLHTTRETYNITEYSERIAVNQDCSLVVMGFPNVTRNEGDGHAVGTGIVKLWEPFVGQSLTTVAPKMAEISWISANWTNKDEDTKVYRFGFSVDVQNSTWVAGAPGKVDSDGIPVSLGYAFVFEDANLHSCRSLYETGCVPDGTDCLLDYKAFREYYGFLKYGSGNLKDTDMNEFQKKCIPPQLPYYRGGIWGGGPLNPVRVPYFVWQQFGYDVALTGPLNQLNSSLFISAPGDTNRFMENSIFDWPLEGRNYGLVYAWETSAESPQNNPSIVPGQEITVHWWKPSLLSPYGPPNLEVATYRAYGRAIAASSDTLAVSSYPLYERTHEPFILIYDCIFANCRQSGGIAINDIPKNALHYLEPSDLIWGATAGIVKGDYIPAPSYQNEFIGSDIGVTGSNVIVPNRHHMELREDSPTAFRYGRNARLRESHGYAAVQYGSNTQHWILSNHHKLTHFWPCDLGYTGGKPVDGSTENCNPCNVGLVSNDGWLDNCELCPVNRTTYIEGQSECKEIVPRVYLGFQREDGMFTMAMIVLVGVGLYLGFICCECACTKGRKPRKFTDIP